MVPAGWPPTRASRDVAPHAGPVVGSMPTVSPRCSRQRGGEGGGVGHFAILRCVKHFSGAGTLEKQMATGHVFGTNDGNGQETRSCTRSGAGPTTSDGSSWERAEVPALPSRSSAHWGGWAVGPEHSCVTVTPQLACAVGREFLC